MNSIYSLGALSMMPIVPWVNDKYGRRMSIIVGSLIMVVGAVLQTCSINCKFLHDAAPYLSDLNL